MALVAAKCTMCGASIKVDDSQERGICEHCGTEFITEKVIVNYVTNITNVDKSTNIFIGTTKTLQKYAEELEALEKIGEDEKIVILTHKVMDEYPAEGRGCPDSEWSDRRAAAPAGGIRHGGGLSPDGAPSDHAPVLCGCCELWCGQAASCDAKTLPDLLPLSAAQRGAGQSGGGDLRRL